jgi:ThiF family
VTAPDLSADERRRYDRHLILPEFGEDGQRRLRDGRVLIVGAGGLGSPAALYLAAAGVGTIGLVDFDAVDVTNLQRQILYGTPDIGTPKLAAAGARLHALNPHVEVVPHDEPFSVTNARALVDAYDVVFGERRVRDGEAAERLRQRVPVRRAGVRVRDAGRTVLPVSSSGAAAGRPDSELRRRWRAGGLAGRHRDNSGN